MFLWIIAFCLNSRAEHLIFLLNTLNLFFLNPFRLRMWSRLRGDSFKVISFIPDKEGTTLTLYFWHRTRTKSDGVDNFLFIAQLHTAMFLCHSGRSGSEIINFLERPFMQNMILFLIIFRVPFYSILHARRQRIRSELYYLFVFEREQSQ